jgi:hypothetical protein
VLRSTLTASDLGRFGVKPALDLLHFAWQPRKENLFYAPIIQWALTQNRQNDLVLPLEEH